MQAYIIRRSLLIIPTLLLVTIMIFFSVRLIPGDVVKIMVAESEFMTGKGVEAIRHELGLDVSIPVQYGRWISGVVRGDLGNSLWSGQPVLEMLVSKLPVSFELGLLAIFVGLLIALPVGIYSAIRQDTGGDYVGRILAIACIALPNFWLGTMVMVFPAIWWHWSPPMEYISFIEDPIGNLQMFIVPSILLGMGMSGITMRMTRTMMLEVLRQDYIRTAWAKGLRERIVIFRHALKNALIPVVTIAGLQIPILIGGSVVLESIFNLPGMGRLLVVVIHQRDYTVISGINLIMSSVVLVTNLGVDLTYAFLDPRVLYK
ncbi:Dipeptide transport system permease protein DppB [subsurface metagenome]